jgi:hypothetical protein
VSMLMVFLIQNTQNRESSALQLKIDEVAQGSTGRSKRIHQSRRLERRRLEPLERAILCHRPARPERTNLPSGESEPTSGASPTSRE